MERGQPIYTSAKHGQCCTMLQAMQLNHHKYLTYHGKCISTFLQLKDAPGKPRNWQFFPLAIDLGTNEGRSSMAAPSEDFIISVFDSTIHSLSATSNREFFFNL